MIVWLNGIAQFLMLLLTDKKQMFTSQWYIRKEDGLVAGTYELQQKKPTNQIHVKDKVAC